jgi:peptidyl-dipeptidase Dcp
MLDIMLILRLWIITFDWMQANGVITRAIVNVLKPHLSVGSVDLNKAFKDFIGHDMQNRT